MLLRAPRPPAARADSLWYCHFHNDSDGAWLDIIEFTASGKDYYTCKCCSPGQVARALTATEDRKPELFERARELAELGVDIKSLRLKFTSFELSDLAWEHGASLQPRCARQPYRVSLTRFPGAGLAHCARCDL